MEEVSLLERKKIKIENSLQQIQEYVIEEYDDHIVLAKLLTEEIEVADIPQLINGKPVTVIGDGCFYLCSALKEVHIPEGIEVIGQQAFALCRSLKELILPDSITEIGDLAFRDCRGLKKIVIPKYLKRIPAGAFAFCYLHDPEIILPDGLEAIESVAFASAGHFYLKIPDSVTEIGVGAFKFGPIPLTKLPEDKGWYSEWPFGKTVACSDGRKGIITDVRSSERNCRIFEVTVESQIEDYFYPCDYIDNKISFADKKDQQGFERDVKHIWNNENELKNAYRIRNAWMRGLKGWEWPFGEAIVCSDGREGIITDVRHFEQNCRSYEVTIGSQIENYFYPCDYIDGKISFTDRENQQEVESGIRHFLHDEKKLKNAYQIRAAWVRGLI